MRIPKLILLDEVDRSLHPSMIKNLLYLIKNVFVNKYKIKVIMTTHSPTTIALADEKSIFYMYSDMEKRLVKESKNSVIKNLAVGIPTLAVTYLNRKYVVTESSYDTKNLEEIYNILLENNLLSKEISLNFIPSSLNGTQNSGDCKNESKGNVFILAEEERYSIENCILDPLLIALLLLHEVGINFDPERLGLHKGFTLTKNIDGFVKHAQKIADIMVEKFHGFIDFDISQTREVEYVNGIKLNIPEGFLNCQGHKLEELLKNEVYKELSRFHNSNELCESVIKILQYYPQFIPKCFVDVFQKILD